MIYVLVGLLIILICLSVYFFLFPNTKFANSIKSNKEIVNMLLTIITIIIMILTLLSMNKSTTKQLDKIQEQINTININTHKLINSDRELIKRERKLSFPHY